MTSKPKLFLVVGRAKHFLAWERPEYERYFELVDAPGPDVLVHGYSTDTFFGLHELPARSRSAYVRPGWTPTHPFYDLELRQQMSDYAAAHLDVAFVNPGPLWAAFRDDPTFALTTYTIDLAHASWFRPRTELRSLLHLSADWPTKDWRRNAAIMAATGLDHLVYPPRDGRGAYGEVGTAIRVRRKVNGWARKLRVPLQLEVPNKRYVEQEKVLPLLASHDGFVHVAAPMPPRAESQYVATLLEAGLTGALLFWYDTQGCGGYLETVFEVDLDPEVAAAQILDIAASTDIAAHSRRTHEEIRAVFDPRPAIRDRCEKMLEAAERR